MRPAHRVCAIPLFTGAVSLVLRSDDCDDRRAPDRNPDKLDDDQQRPYAWPQGQAAMEDLVGQYHDAVTRYIHLKVRDKHLADEVLQEFWTKLLAGKLAGADKSKGRFRDYLRTVLHRLIIDHFRTRKLQPLPPGDLMDPSRPDEDFDRVWREAVITRVWSRLETYQARPPRIATPPSCNCGATFPRPRSRRSPPSSAKSPTPR